MGYNLSVDVKVLLTKYKINPDIKKDQFFLIDEKVVEKLIGVAGVTKNDRVLEIGPGLGLLTLELVKKAKEVIAIEIDRRFEPILKSLPDNVEVIWGDAYRLSNDKSFRAKVKPPTKVVANIPYSQAQNMLHNYTNSDWYKGDLVWLAPTSLADKVNREHILGAYFIAKVVEKIPKLAFYPQPNTASAIIYFRRVPDPKKTGDFAIYFRRWLYNHEDWKVKNVLREGIIKAAFDLKGVKVTKNQARKMITNLALPDKELEKLTNNIWPEYYFEIPKKLGNWFKALWVAMS